MREVSRKGEEKGNLGSLHRIENRTRALSRATPAKNTSKTGGSAG